MDRVKAMPERDKFRHAFEMVRLYQKHVLPFVEAQLGYAEMHNLRSVWQAGIIPIREEGSEKEKYEQAFSNWLWVARCSHDALSDQLSKEEILEYKRLLLKLYVQVLDNPDLVMLRLFSAHGKLAKALLYEMQWLTPIEVTSFSNRKVTCVVHDCKIRQLPQYERVCRVDCMHLGAAYANKVYHLTRITIPSDHGCTFTLTPWEKQED
jgi:hypothetical protein